MAGDGGVVFDLFHTLVDPELVRPPDFRASEAAARACGLDVDAFASFWAGTYVERETTPVDLVDLVDRFCEGRRSPLTETERSEVDDIFGFARDDVLLSPDPDLVVLVAQIASRTRVGVLSNCYEREVRRWPDSPFAPHVTVFARSCDIGAMKPDVAAYRSITDAMDIDPVRSTYVGNGASDELLGARRAGFGVIVHCNVYDRANGMATPAEQRRRANQADTSVDSISELAAALLT